MTGLAAPRPAHLAGAVDSHAHVFGPAARYAFDPERPYTPPDAPVDAYLAMLDSLAMARGVLVQGTAHGLDNAALLAALQASPERLRGIATVPAQTSAEDLRTLRRRGVVGLRFHSDADPRHAGSVRLSAAAAHVHSLQRAGLQVQLLAKIDGIDEVALRHLVKGGVPVTIDHFGLVDVVAGTGHWAFRRLCDWVREGLVHVKLSAGYRLASLPDLAALRPFHEALVEAGSNRLLWGTDWPHPRFDAGQPKASDLLALFLACTPEPMLQRRILVENPTALFFASTPPATSP
ncbi:MAG: hypothetical protein JWP29_3804 [Rhodoferax sp.]|nr:hypothetical protein [Rhodoferax sp.]